MPPLQIPSSVPKSAGPRSAIALDFEALTWREAVNSFRMQSDHKTQRLDEFLKTYTTPQAVSQTLRERQRDAPNQYGPVLSKVLGKIDIFLAAGDIAVKGAPESVGLAWTGISLALGSVQDDFATFQLFSGACVDIIGIMVTCRLFGRMFASAKGPAEFFEIQDQVRNSIPKIYDKILEFSYQMFKYMDRNKFLRITRGILKNNKEEFAGGIKDIKEYERLMSENATKASQALTSYWQQQSSEKQDQMLGDLKLIREQLSESSAASKEMNDYLKKELEEQRRKTPMDVARESYVKNKQRLRANVDIETMLKKRTSVREEGTCKWIFDTDAYKHWHDSSGSSMLWVSGGGNMGKSVLVSSIIDRLREETINTPEEFAFFFFCKSGDDNAQHTERIMDHLLYYMYDLVPMTLELLDRCNDIVRQYLASRTEGRSRKRGQQDSSESEKILYFEDAFQKMAEVLKKKVYLVVDALDECSDRKEEELIQRLATMADRKDLKIKILLTSRPETDISEVMDKCELPEIRMDKFNEGDIYKTVQAQLALIPGMTSTERTIARDKICNHAGPYFGYLNPALELLRRPWQRPIEVHLEQLPENLLNMNARIFLNTDPSYIGFLKTCLTWAILANGQQKLKISELIDIYSNRFLLEADEIDDATQEQEELTEEVTKFYKQQIRKAGDTFLDLDEKSKELNLIKPALVKDSFLKTHEQAEELRRRNTEPDECPCRACRATKKQQSNFILTAKHGHLEIARQIFKHLNSPLFQKIYLPNIGAGPEVSVPGTRTASPEPSQKDDEETDADADAAPSSTNGEPESSGAHLLSATSPIATGTDHAETNGLAVDHGPDEDLAANTDEIPEAQDINEESKPRLTLNTNAEEPMAAADANETGDEVVVLENGSDDSPEENKPKEDQDEVNSVADSDVEENDNRQFAPRSDNVYVYPRYEISQAMYHLQMVEEQWTAEDNRTEEFELLFEDVVRFFHGPGFAAWKEFEVSRPKAPLEGQAAATSLTALHITAANGLVELSRRLLDKQEAEAQANASVERADTTENGAPQDDTEPEFNMGGVADGANSDINARTVSGTTPLWWAASVSGAERRYNICKLLLERGALPGVDALRRADGELVNQEPPFHSLLYNSATEARVVRLFLDNGAKATETDPYGYNALHDFAWVGSDPEILDMLIEAGADINVKDDGGETPLHKLLNGRGTETPLDLLKRFLHHKADITVDDKYGQQALFEVAQSGSVEALKVILSHDPAPEIDHKEIDDWTALHNAARGGNVEGCKLLCDAGANVVSLDNRKCTPLYISVFSDNVETVDYLTKASLEKDENVLRLRTVSDKTVLRKSAALGKTEFVKLLLKKYRDHLDVDAADETLLWTPLHIAAYKGLTDIVELLLEHGADPKCKDKRGNTALVLCYQQWELLHSTDATRDASFENCLVELIEADREAAVGQTHLLSAAARKGSIAVLEALVLSRPGEPRADPVLRDEFGWTAIELAKQFKRQLAVDFLQQHSGFTGRFPDAWKITKPKLSRFDADVRELHFIGDYSDDDGWESRVTVFSDVPIPANLERYYYEVKVEFPDPAKAIEGKHTIGVGVFAAQASKYSGGGLEECFPGHSATAKRGTQSWAYHGDDGWVGSSLYGYHDEHQLRSELFGHGDVVGCAIDFRKGHVFWTKNGKRLMEKAFDDVSARLTPVIGLLQPVKVTTTFIKPFVWKPGDTLDFEADLPSEMEKRKPEGITDVLANGVAGEASFEETYRELYNATPNVGGS